MSSSTSASHEYHPQTTTMSNGSNKDSVAAESKTSPYGNSPSPDSYDTEKIAYGIDPAASSTTLGSTDPRTQDIKSWGLGFERMQDERLEKQRYIMSGKKDDEVSLVALGAKVERALGRRMTGQDAVFTPRGGQTLQELPAELPSKRSVEVQTAS